MKIMFFSSYPLFSGSHKMALQLAGFARDAGHEVLIGAPDDNLYIQKARECGFETHIYQAPVCLLETGGAILKRNIFQKIGLGLFKFLPYQLKVWRAMHAQKIDLIYIAQERGVLQIGTAAKLCRIPVIWHVQGGLKDGAGFIHRIAAALSAQIICVSRAVQEDFLTFANARHKTSVVYNGLPDIEIEAERKMDGKIRILFAANITPHKGAHILIEAAALLKNQNIHIDIAGWVQDQGYRDYLLNLIRIHGLEDMVTLHGYVENIHHFYRNTDIVVCPTIEAGALNGQDIWWKEGFNLSALEGMRAGKVVICSATYGLKEVVENGISGLHVEQNNYYELANALEKTIETPRTAKRMGDGGRARYEALFTEAHMKHNFLKILEKF